MSIPALVKIGNWPPMQGELHITTPTDKEFGEWHVEVEDVEQEDICAEVFFGREQVQTEIRTPDQTFVGLAQPTSLTKSKELSVPAKLILIGNGELLEVERRG